MAAASAHKPICHIITPVGMLGYGFTLKALDEELTKLKSDEHVPTAIIMDSGSTDGGPLKLATGALGMPQSTFARDLSKVVRMVNKHKVPVIIGSAGGDGSNDHVDVLVNIVKELFSSVGVSRPLKVLALYSEIAKEFVLERLSDGKITGCGTAVPELTVDAVHSASRILAQMGPEPFIDAMAANPDFDIIIGGRAYDPAPYVAFASACYAKAHRLDPFKLDSKAMGSFYHMGQIMECGGACAKPKTNSAVATIYDDFFTVYPLGSGTKCTPLTVAAHCLYEKSRPDFLLGPGGALNLANAKYEQDIDGKTVRASGATFARSRDTEGKYTVKLEGATVSGYRSMIMGSFGDPILTNQMDSFLHRVNVYVEQQHHDEVDNWRLHMHRYGEAPGQIFLVAECLADNQALASSVVSTARVACIHGPYPGQKATSGNFAFGIGGLPEFETGPCAVFCIYHLMQLTPGEERGSSSTSAKSLFTWRTINLSLEAGHKQRNLSIFKTTDPPKTPIPYYPAAQITFDTLSGIAQVIRSKNAGPFEITIDVIFEHDWCYNIIKSSTLLTKESIMQLFSLPEEDLIYEGYFDQAKAYKITFPRRREGITVPNGGFMEDDMHGSQRYRPLSTVKIPEELKEKLIKAYEAWKKTAGVEDQVDNVESGENGVEAEGPKVVVSVG